jgi:hypothetical protein
VELNRRRRRQLLWFLAGFVAVQGALAVGVERLWPGARDPEYAARERRLRQARAAAPHRPLVVALGSSRTLMAIDARRLSETPGENGEPAPLVFTFGVPGSGPMMETVCLRRLLAAGLRPDLLLVEVVPMGLNRRGDRPEEERQLDPARLRIDEVAFLLGGYYDRPDLAWPRWLLARVLPCYRHQAELRAELGLDVYRGRDPEDKTGALDDHGWQPFGERLTPRQRQERTAFALGQYEDCVSNFRLAPGTERALRDLLDLCRREGIRTALVLMPEGPAFRALYPAGTRVAIDAFVRGLAGEYGAPLIDARTWADELGETAFWDSHHLHADGAAFFTERFGREVVRPLLRGGTAPPTPPPPSDTPGGPAPGAAAGPIKATGPRPAAPPSGRPGAAGP